jgi:threonine synthase
VKPQTTSERCRTAHGQLRCIECGTTCDSAGQTFRCRACGDLLEIAYDNPTVSNGSASSPALKACWRERKLSSHIADQSGVWRFRDLLPHVQDLNSIVTLREGNTPVYELSRCAKAAGVNTLLAKHQGMNPTGSFKDTGMTVAASFAKEAGYNWVACASTGNTSASMAAYAARAGMRALVLIPEGKISWGKLSQSLDYGALTCQLKTDFDGCMRVLNEVVQRMPVYLLNSINPYRIEGQKTAAIELLEQLNWAVPDHIIVPGGNLGNSSAIGKALSEMHALGLISRLPKLSIIQAEGANPFVRMIRGNASGLTPVNAETLATAIRIGNPASWKKALRVLQQTGGMVEQVTELEIAQAKAEIGSDGIGCEPASAVTLAGLKKLVVNGFVKKNEIVVLLLTGHLLKDPEFTLKFHRGELFAATRHENQATGLTSYQRAPIVLDADAGAVIAALQHSEQS